MAVRPVFVTSDIRPYVDMISTAFRFYPGLAVTQARKSVHSLHEAFLTSCPEHTGKVLEISSRSPDALGVQLSAFNLQYSLSDGSIHTVETVFQSSKCFENGSQYIDLLDRSSYEAKKDGRLRSSGNVVAFRLEGKEFPILPTTFFYDWIYLNAIHQNNALSDQLLNYSAFTDIAFNPARSFNCQARSAALYVSLCRSGLLTKALSAPEEFMRLVYDAPAGEVHTEQMTIFDL